MEGSWRKMCFSPAPKWLKCSARASILWLNESGTISRGASFWCAGAWSQPASDQRSPASVWLKETRWDWLENLCNARAPAAAAHAPSQHSPRPKGRRKLGGWGGGWALTFGVFWWTSVWWTSGGVYSLHVLFFSPFDFRDASVLPFARWTPDYFYREFAGSFSSFCSIKTYKTQPVSDDCQVNQKFFPPPLSSVPHQIGESLISRLCGSI